ncbi:unnamed protein product [Prunus armeniaca]|uniref:Uncharacterized protein n=1 Tax=Prunus armeniaca TaxID=36596 RepID=A0A6J5XX88_PRUAR|nr:unnamed protein product [Prunus armeniaca]
MIGAGSNYEFKADNPQGLGPFFNHVVGKDTEIVEVGVEARVPEDIILGLVPAPAPEPVIVHARTPAHQGYEAEQDIDGY